MLKSKEIIMTWTSYVKKWYIVRGYIFTKLYDEFNVRIEDLTPSSKKTVDVECDGCGILLENIVWDNYKRCVKEDGKYYCHKCSINGCKQWVSFEDWCLKNSKLSILNRWDYELNNYKPSDITWGSGNKYYFKCPKGLHKSELKSIHNFTKGNEGVMNCIICNSLGHMYPEVFKMWSNKNSKSPYDYSQSSSQFVWWKCPDEKHQDFYRNISDSSKICNFRCPECQFSQGEERISNCLIYNNWIKITQEEFDNLLNKNCNYYIPQKTFDRLLGLGGGLLSYDFYLPKYNLLIEYQGLQHEKFCGGIHKSKKDFEKQVEHDRRKKEYTLENKYYFLEIWYCDFDNIEKILESKLKELSIKDNSFLCK